MPQVPLRELIQAAKDGYVVSFPTDTVPALAALPTQASSIYQIKQRSLDKSLILMGDRAENLWDFVMGGDREREIWQEVADKYWPGALTLVLPASDRFPTYVNIKKPGTIGMRVPDCAIAREILAQTKPLVTTSANLSGQPALLSLEEISQSFSNVFVLETSAPLSPSSSIPSTVAQWTGNGWEILRQGEIFLA